MSYNNINVPIIHKFTYEEIKRCMQFNARFTDMYVRYNSVMRGTIFETLYSYLAEFEYSLNSGVLDDPKSHEYGKAKKSIENVRDAMKDVITSHHKLADTYLNDLLMECYVILSAKKL